MEIYYWIMFLWKLKIRNFLKLVIFFLILLFFLKKNNFTFTSEEGKLYLRLSNFEKSIHLNDINKLQDIDQYQAEAIRAPETIFKQSLGTQIDMWSFGKAIFNFWKYVYIEL